MARFLRAKKPENTNVKRRDQKQSRRFVEAARALGADQSEEAFDKALRRIAKAPVPAKKKKD